jgi:hypothetical protein
MTISVQRAGILGCNTVRVLSSGGNGVHSLSTDIAGFAAPGSTASARRALDFRNGV